MRILHLSDTHLDRTDAPNKYGVNATESLPEPDSVLESGASERAAVSTVADGWRFVTLDSLVPGHIHGQLSRAQLDWLRDVLREPAAQGTVLALHHPPISLDMSSTQAVFGLRDPGK